MIEGSKPSKGGKTVGSLIGVAMFGGLGYWAHPEWWCWPFFALAAINLAVAIFRR